MSDVKILTSENATTFEPWAFPEVKSSHTLAVEEQQKQEAFLAQQQEQLILQEEKLQQALEQGYQEGLARGREEAKAEIRSQYEPLWQEKLQVVTQFLEKITEPLTQVDHELELLLSDLVMQLTRHLLQNELSTTTNTIVELVRKSLELLPNVKKNLRIHVNAQDKKILEQGLHAEYVACLLEDSHLQPGEFRFSSDTSELDATFETRLAKLFSHVFHEGK